MYRAWIEVNLGAIKHNVLLVKEWIGERVQLAAVVKANGYGHGVLPVAETALSAGADRLCVATIEEGIELREHGIATPIHVFTPPLADEVEAALEHNLELTLDHPDLLRAIGSGQRAVGNRMGEWGKGRVGEETKNIKHQTSNVKLHLKIDTGMSRLGVLPENLPDLLEKLSQLPGVSLEGVCTHFACADADPEQTREQLRQFKEAIALLEARGFHPRLRHAANSAATLSLPESHLDLVRVGLLIYGINPLASQKHHPLTAQLRPALSLKARVVSMREVPAGRGISYGHTYRTKRSSRIATLGIGYGDGYPRRLSNLGYVLLRGEPAPILGRICMDLTMVDVTDIPGVQMDDLAVLIGEDGNHRISIEQIVEWLETTPHEVTTVLGSRLGRVYCE